MTPAEIEAAFDDLGNSVTSKKFWNMVPYLSDLESPRKEWQDRVRGLLDHEDPFIVALGIEILAIRWKRSEFLTECLAFARHEDEEIARTAIEGLSVLGLGSEDYDLAAFFMELLQDEQRSSYVRSLGITAIPRILEGVVGPELLNLAVQARGSDLGSDELNDIVPLAELGEMLERHRP